MPMYENLVEGIEATDRLELGLRMALQKKTLELRGLDDKAGYKFIKNYAATMAEIFDNDEVIKSEARQGNMDYAASLLNDKLSEVVPEE